MLYFSYPAFTDLDRYFTAGFLVYLDNKLSKYFINIWILCNHIYTIIQTASSEHLSRVKLFENLLFVLQLEYWNISNVTEWTDRSQLCHQGTASFALYENI